MTTSSALPAKVSEAKNPAVNFAKVRKDENAEVRALYEKRNPNDPALDAHLHAARFGLAFSGGGIRSASVNLGFIQALAKANLLRRVDYISGISGGGYMLGWLISWIRRCGFEVVQEQLETSPSRSNENPPDTSGRPRDEQYHRFVEPQPIHHLRQYASYLSPRMGLGSGDTLALISIFLRNLLLNQALIISVAIVLVALAQMLAPRVAWRGPLPAAIQCIILVVLFSAAVFAGRVSGNSLLRLGQNQDPAEWKLAGIASAFASLVVAICLWLILPTTFTDRFIAYPLIPVFIAKYPAVAPSLFAAVSVAVTYSVGWLTDRADHGQLKAVDDSTTDLWGASGRAIFAATVFIFALMWACEKWLHQDVRVIVSDWYVMLGVPAVLVAFALTSYVHVGMFGAAYPDAKREWLGRIAGYWLYFAVIAAVIMIGALRGPLWMHFLFRGAAAKSGVGEWLKWILPGGWIFSVVGGLYAGASPKTGNDDQNQHTTLELLARIGPAIFLAGVFLLVSWTVYSLATYTGNPYLNATPYLTWVHDVESHDAGAYVVTETRTEGTHTYQAYQPGTTDKPEDRSAEFELSTETGAQPSAATPQIAPKAAAGSTEPIIDAWSVLRALLLVAVIPFLVALALLFYLDVNEFSLYLLYRNRLVRAFLGASNIKSEACANPGRRPSPFTGLALDDDVPLQEISSQWERCRKSSGKPSESPEPRAYYDGPYPIWGTALNLTTGEDLAWQRRKAASFIYSPLYCGWDYAGKDPSPREYPDDICNGSSTEGDLCRHAYRGTGRDVPLGAQRTPYTGLWVGPTIGTAMAASGAAIAPNWGYHSKPSVAALLALFNLRVGLWSGNPRRNDCAFRYGPGAWYLGAELLGSTNDRGGYVYLSDGGHFENLGIYELVRRRLKYIIVCDADADPSYNFRDLANAVEKCRRDFGVQIDIDTGAIKPQKKDSRLSTAHFAVGAITYPAALPDRARAGEPDSAKEAPKPETGVLLYIKSSLTGNEPADVLGQQSESNSFPHDTTVNQFFDETQFEVYRALGEHMFHEIWHGFETTRGWHAAPGQRRKLDLDDFFIDYLNRQKHAQQQLKKASA